MGAWDRPIRRQFGNVLLAQRGQLLCWVPVCLALGIGCYFGLKVEPSLLYYISFGAVAFVFFCAAQWLPEEISPLAMAATLCLTGFILAGVRAHSVGGPVLNWRYYGAVEGRVIGMDRSQSDALRLTLDQVYLERVPPAKTPNRVRISLHATEAGITPEPGLRVMTTAHLSPPAGPVEPGGFDFQRHAWFARLGAVGYSRVPLVGAVPAHKGYAGLAVFRIRMAASARIHTHLAGDVGGVAAAITTGDRSAISREALEDLRASNLAHLLAISGLHMGLLTAVVFGALRFVFAAIPYVALHWPTKGLAAAGALVAAIGYLALSGGNVATQRAFIMVAVALGALILGRRALSLRAVAVAASIVLVLRPEALMGPGFQMSFSATTALVVVFGHLRGIETAFLPSWSKPAFGVFVSSAIAGLATAPFAAAHFNTVAHYGLVANLLSVPLMGLVVIPAAVAALILSIVGLEAVGLWVMGLGLRWILGVAAWISEIDGARGFVVAPGEWVLPLLALGALAMILVQGHLRWSGGLAVATAFVLWANKERPEILIGDQGTLVGWMTPIGRALSREKGAGFVARNWLENDGDDAGQETAAQRWRGAPVVHLAGKRAVASFGKCEAAQLIVTSVRDTNLERKGCTVFDPDTLKQTGALALSQNGDKWEITTARALAGDRLWTQWPSTNNRKTLN